MAASAAAGPPIEGYNAQGARQAKAARRAAPVSQPASPPAAGGTSSAPASTPAEGWSIELPSGIPGNSIGEKALLVFGVLLLGLFFYSRVTGKPIALGLAGPSSKAPLIPNPNDVGGISHGNTMAERVAIANPSKVA